MTQTANHMCAMCGTDRTEGDNRKHIVGKNGAICLACVAICNSVVSAPDNAPAEGTRFPVVELGNCVLCSRPKSGAEYSDGYLKGLHGDLCKVCLDLCNEIQEQDYSRDSTLERV